LSQAIIEHRAQSSISFVVVVLAVVVGVAIAAAAPVTTPAAKSRRRLRRLSQLFGSEPIALMSLFI
jgi:uncharacterized protein (UPF0333 family)